MSDPLIQFVKAKRKARRMTQHDLADLADLGLPAMLPGLSQDQKRHYSMTA